MQQKSKKAEEILRSELQRDPTNREIAEKLGMSLEEYEEWEIAFNANVHQSLDSVYDEYSIWFASKESSPEEALSNSQLKNTLKDALSCLPKKEALVIQLYYVEELNVYEIAEVMDITTGRVSQIKKSAISKLRNKIKEASI
jgi:RNA polymerase sigma factor for flagellar operon FliA